MITRAKNNISKPKFPSDDTIRYPLARVLLTVANLDLVELTCYSYAVKHPKWRQAMNL
jgi:hypothetical protein